MANCILVGLGNMGWRYDAQSEGVLTHAKAIYEHPQLQLIAAVDPSDEARNAFNRRYSHVPSFAALQDACAQQTPDWIILALPTQLHFAAFNEALSFKPKVIVCEKPLAPTAAQAREMYNRAKAQGVLLFINYIRPHEPYCKAMFNFIQTRVWGGVEKIVVRYGKGIANNASHFIQLLVLAFGTPEQVRLINANNTALADLEPDFILQFGQVQAIFLRFDYQLYALSEMDIYLQQGAIFYRTMGQQIEYCQAQADVCFPSIKRLQPVRSETTELNFYQRHALAYYYFVWQNHADQDALAQSAIDALDVVERIQVHLHTSSSP